MEDEPKKKKTYVEAPQVDEELQSIWQAVLQSYVGMIEVTEGARRLGLSRNHFQTKMHKAMSAAVDTLMPQPKGRPAKPIRERELEEENARLRRELAKSREELESVEKILGVATAFVKDRSRSSRTKKEKAVGKPEREEPDGAARAKLQTVESLRAQGLKVKYAVAAALMSASTYRRYKMKCGSGMKLVNRRGPGPREITLEVWRRVEQRVNATRGVLGAATLAHEVAGSSRRICAEVKAAMVTERERQRKQASLRVTVGAPGIIRGMDQKYVPGVRAPLLLICSDGQVPYRTSIEVIGAYTGEEVRRVLERDVEKNGAPLVYRMDRASAHRVSEVKELLAEKRILVLHGPPRYPRYYGQLENQNRQHEAWLATAAPSVGKLDEECERMKTELNRAPRRSLKWASAEERWEQRPDVEGWRHEVWNEVQSRVARNWRQSESQARIDVERLAIEDALISRGLMRIEVGGWC